MTTLEKVIKDLEFENEDLIRQIKDEIEQIDGIQKNTEEKSNENVKLEEAIEQANQETKSLHEHFKQNKEIVESLNNATELLQRHCGDLENSLKLRIQEAEIQRQEHLTAIDGYTEKWLKYEAEYEKRPLAQEARKLKLEAANLDSKEKELFQKKEELKEQVKSYDYHGALLKNQKDEAIKCIVQLAKIKITTNGMVMKLGEVQKEETELQQKQGQKTKDLTDLQLQLKQKAKDDEAARIHTNNGQETSSSLQKPMFSFDQRTDIKAKPKNKEQRQSPKLPKFPTPKPFQLPKLSMPKFPQLPKFSPLPTFSPSPSIALKPPISLPKTNSTSPQHQQQHQQQKQLLQQQQHQQQQQQREQEEAKSNQGESRDDQAMSTDTDEVTIGDNDGGSVVNNDQSVEEAGDQERIYQIPLDQSNKEFFRELSNSEYGDLRSPVTPTNSQFRFSPGQHAEQLKFLKQSPAGGYFLAGRPMFQNDDDTGAMECEGDDSEFTSAFSSQHQFMGFVHERDGDMKTATGAGHVAGESFKDVEITEGKAPTFSVPKSTASPSVFSFDSPRVSMNASTNNNDNNNSNTMFNFGLNEGNPSEVTASGASAFNFTGRATSESTSAMNTGSAFNYGASEFNFNTTEDDDCDSSMFDFTIRNNKASDVGSAGMFNFGAVDSVTSPSSDNNNSGFPFNVNNASSSSPASQTTFSFNF